MLKRIFKFIFQVLFRVKVTGYENYEKAGEKVLIVSNHVSFLDAVLLVLFLPDTFMFAINSQIANRWFIKPLLYFVQAFSLDPTNSLATKSIIQEIRKGRKCIIFPEGRITLTGSLMKIYQGPALIAEKSGAKILPIHIRGAERTYFSKLQGIQKLCLFPKIEINILESTEFIIKKSAKDQELNARERRKIASNELYNLMSNMQFKSEKFDKTLFESLIETSKKYGKNHIIAEDKEREPICYRELLLRSFLLGKKFCYDTSQGDFVGVLLPNSLAAISTFFALQAYSRVPAMLNFSTGQNNIENACKAGNIKVVYTAKGFVETANLENIIAVLENNDIRVIYLEDVRSKISLLDKVLAYFQSYFPKIACRKLNIANANTDASENFSKEQYRQPCVVLFTSGTENTPKGVVLSHENILANIAQASARCDFGPKDILFNVLPIFHSFGLTGGTLLPILSGVRTFFYPTPLHYRIIPELIYDTCATIMFGTDTFLGNYAKFAHVYDFRSIRYLFAGAEKLKEQTRELYAHKFGIRILEGYGATETSPILSLNTPLEYKEGTVGRLLPGIEYSLEKVEGVEIGGKLFVKGKNIMLGYLYVDSPGVIQKLKNNIYDTGDIVNIDEGGYVSIIGRVKRFAKIAGEMVSLNAVEDIAQKLWVKSEHAVISIFDDKKGEALVLLTTYQNANREKFLAFAKKQGASELYIPKRIEIVEKIPLLGTGKVDYVELKKLI